MRLIDADKFNSVIYHVPDDVYDAYSYVQGIEFVLDKIREAKTIIDIPDTEAVVQIDWNNFREWREKNS